MTPHLIDISMPLNASTPIWPGSPGFSSRSHLSLASGDVANATLLGLDAHCGTHVDAPRHFVPAGATIDEVGLAALVGGAWVVDVSGTAAIDAAALEACGVPDGTQRLLLRTDNASWPSMGHVPFHEDYVALTPDAARWVVQRGIRLVGIDYLSIQRYADPPDVHEILLQAGVLILEGLNLQEATAGSWTLVCLPLSVTGIEAAPARAVLLEDGWHA
jgi:arylformamidase